MEAKELRISNLILVNDVVQEVVELPLPENCTNDNTKGITLSEEWLLKFGFEENTTSFTKYTSVLNNHLKLRKQASYYFYQMIRIQHVHQLQNLYHALTGEELTFND